jgi:hypothetical protein
MIAEIMLGNSVATCLAIVKGSRSYLRFFFFFGERADKLDEVLTI